MKAWPARGVDSRYDNTRLGGGSLAWSSARSELRLAALLVVAVGDLVSASREKETEGLLVPSWSWAPPALARRRSSPWARRPSHAGRSCLGRAAAHLAAVPTRARAWNRPALGRAYTCATRGGEGDQRGWERGRSREPLVLGAAGGCGARRRGGEAAGVWRHGKGEASCCSAFSEEEKQSVLLWWLCWWMKQGRERRCYSGGLPC